MSFRIEHRVGLPASPEIIWDVVADLKRWREWNPLYPEVSGLLRIGQTLDLLETFPHDEPRRTTVRVIDWVPGAQILWGESSTLGLVKRLHYIEIEPLNDEQTACILATGTVFSGMVGERAARRNVRRIREGFQTMNDAAAARILKMQAGEIARPEEL